MIKIKTENGTTSIEAKGNDSTLFSDACVITKCIYTSLRDELSNKDVAEMFKSECTNGSVFCENAEADDEEVNKEIGKMLDDLIEKLKKLGKKEDDD